VFRTIRISGVLVSVLASSVLVSVLASSVLVTVLASSVLVSVLASSVLVSVLASSVVDRGFIGGVLVSVLASSVVDRGFEPRSGQTKYSTIGMCCFSTKHTALLVEETMSGIRTHNFSGDSKVAFDRKDSSLECVRATSCDSRF
jgi:hypothetical protein